MKQQVAHPLRAPHAGRLSLLLVAISMSTALALAGTSQRMFIEAQNFSIPAGGTSQPRAMCLDESAPSPSPATRFTYAPASLGDIRIAVNGHEMPLQSAIDRHIIEVRGTQGYSSVKFRNLLPSATVKVLVRRNSVLIPDRSYATADLRGLPELAAAGMKVDQQELWASRRGAPRTLAPIAPSPAYTQPRVQRAFLTCRRPHGPVPALTPVQTLHRASSATTARPADPEQLNRPLP